MTSNPTTYTRYQTHGRTERRVPKQQKQRPTPGGLRIPISADVETSSMVPGSPYAISVITDTDTDRLECLATNNHVDPGDRRPLLWKNIIFFRLLASQTTSVKATKHNSIRSMGKNNRIAQHEAVDSTDNLDKGPALVDQEDEADQEAFVSDGKYRNKQRCLVLCLRGATARYRHLLEDLRTLLPHHKKESKLDPGKGGIGRAVNDIAEMRSCNSVLFLECRKHQDAYLWMGKVGERSGPSVKFHVSNVHTMDELRLTGNCMKGSRPLLSFDESFENVGYLKLLKELFTDVFGTPRGHPKSKPFVDRIMSFYYADKKIWVRNYQILEQQPTNALEAHLAKKTSGKEEATSLVEIGPRFVLNPIRIFRGSFGGQTLFQNPDFVSPNEIRAMQYKRKNNAYVQRKENEKKRKLHKEDIVVPEDPLGLVFK